jgi:hypothetical protein
MQGSLKWLSKTIRENGTNGDIHLIMDAYRAHTPDTVKHLVRRLGFVLPFMPAGFIDLY